MTEFVSKRTASSCGFSADGAVVLAVFPDAGAGPGLRLYEILKSFAGEDARLRQLFCRGRRAAKAFGHSHQDQGQRGSKRGSGLGDEADAAGAQCGEDRGERRRRLGEDEEEARGDDDVDLAGRLGERESVGLEKAAIAEAGAAGLFFGSGQERLGEVDAGDVELGKSGGETAGVKAWAAACLDEISRLGAVEHGRERGGDVVGVVGEEVFAAEGVLTPTSIEQSRG